MEPPPNMEAYPGGASSSARDRQTDRGTGARPLRCQQPPCTPGASGTPEGQPWELPLPCAPAADEWPPQKGPSPRGPLYQRTFEKGPPNRGSSGKPSWGAGMPLGTPEGGPCVPDQDRSSCSPDMGSADEGSPGKFQGAKKGAVSPHLGTPDPLSPHSPDCALSQSSSFNFSALTHSSSLTLSASSSSSHSLSQAALLSLQLRLTHSQSHSHSRSHSSRAPGGSVSQPSSLNFSSLQRGLSRQSEETPSPHGPSVSLRATQSSTRSPPSPSPREPPVKHSPPSPSLRGSQHARQGHPSPQVGASGAKGQPQQGPWAGRMGPDAPGASSRLTAVGYTASEPAAGARPVSRRARSTPKVRSGVAGSRDSMGTGAGVGRFTGTGAEPGRGNTGPGVGRGGFSGARGEEHEASARQAGRGGSGRMSGGLARRLRTGTAEGGGGARGSLRQKSGRTTVAERSRSQGTGAVPSRLFSLSLSHDRQVRGQGQKEGREEQVKGESRRGQREGGSKQEQATKKGGRAGGRAAPAQGQGEETEGDLRALFRRLTTTNGVPLVHRMFPGIKPHVVRPMAPEAQKQELRFAEEYAVGRVLGEGSYGVVRSCIHLKTGRSLAVKIVAKAKLPRARDLARARMEPKVQRRLAGHRHVLQFEDAFEDPRSLFLVTERCTGGDLFELLARAGRLGEHLAAAMFAQLLAAVAHLRRRDVVHRDIKLENILVADKDWKRALRGATDRDGDYPQQHKRGEGGGSEQQLSLGGVPCLKLADFGSAVVVPRGEKASGRSGGSLMYQAPEVLCGRKYDGAIDMWALGVVLFALLSGSFPFTAPSDSLLVGMIKRGVFRMEGPAWQGVSVGAKEIVAALLQPDPDLRAQPAELWAYPWLALFSAEHTQSAQRLGLSKSWTLTGH